MAKARPASKPPAAPVLDQQRRRLGHLDVQVAREPDQVLQGLARRDAETPGQHDPRLRHDRTVVRGSPQVFQVRNVHPGLGALRFRQPLSPVRRHLPLGEKSYIRQ